MASAPDAVTGCCRHHKERRRWRIVEVTLEITALAVLAGSRNSLSARWLCCLSFSSWGRVFQSNTGTSPHPSGRAPDRWQVSSAGLPSALYVPGSWSNRVAHWTTFEYHFDANSRDPGNGRVLHADIWVAIGADGRPVNYHVTYTFADTSVVYQQLYLTHSMMFTELGVAYHSAVARPFDTPYWCVIRSPSTFAAIALRAPLFVD